MTTAAKWKADERARKVAAGLVRIETWLPASLVDRARKYLAKLAKESK